MMLDGHQFSELSDSLASGFAVDRIVRTLARIRREHLVGDQDLAVLRGAKETVEDVWHGEQWPLGAAASHDAAAATTAFEDAAVLLSFRVRNREEFDSALTSLNAALDELLDRKMPSSQDLDHLYDFFAGVGRRRLDESQNILMASSTRAWPEPIAVLRQDPGESG